MVDSRSKYGGKGGRIGSFESVSMAVLDHSLLATSDGISSTAVPLS